MTLFLLLRSSLNRPIQARTPRADAPKPRAGGLPRGSHRLWPLPRRDGLHFRAHARYPAMNTSPASGALRPQWTWAFASPALPPFRENSSRAAEYLRVAPAMAAVQSA